MRLLLGALVFLLGVTTAACAAESPLQKPYLEVYLECKDADSLEKQKDYLGALAHYQVIRYALDVMHRKDPNWELEMLAKKMKDCDTAIARLRLLAEKQVLGQISGRADWAPLEAYAVRASDAEKQEQNWPALFAYQEYEDALKIAHKNDTARDHDLVKQKIAQTIQKKFKVAETVIPFTDSVAQQKF